MNRRGFMGLLGGVAALPLTRSLGATDAPAIEGIPRKWGEGAFGQGRMHEIDLIMQDVIVYGRGVYRQFPDGSIKHLDAQVIPYEAFE